MKKVLVLLSSVLLAGCFICHKTAPQEEKLVIVELVEEQAPVQEENVISRHNIAEVANFAFDSSVVRPDMNKMDDLIKDIQAHPEAVVYVEGHTDNVGPEEYNKALSLDRARAVAQELEKYNFPNEIRTYGAGSTMPIASNDTAEGRAQNRRVDVVLAKDE